MTSLVLTPRTTREFPGCHPMLVEVILTALGIWETRYCFCGSIHRSVTENDRAGAKSTIHVVGPPYRAADLSGRNLARDVGARWKACQLRAAVLNKIFEYDHERPNIPVAYGDPHGSAPHCHLQVHPNTRRRT